MAKIDGRCSPVHEVVANGLWYGTVSYRCLACQQSFEMIPNVGPDEWADEIESLFNVKVVKRGAQGSSPGRSMPGSRRRLGNPVQGDRRRYV